MTRAIYAGTFDPITVGHIGIIAKAAKMFDEVIVVVATNNKKTPMFDATQRLNMVTRDLRYFSNVTVKALDDNKFLVDYAYQTNAQFLIRGIRDDFDFKYEKDLYHINKEINKKIETAYFMPDADVQTISSSLVKSLIGLTGWQKIVENKVSASTLQDLEQKWLEKRFKASMLKLVRHPEIIAAQWEGIVRNYSEDYRIYHNLKHIAYGLNVLDTLDVENKDLITVAWFYHDIFDTEIASAKYAYNLIEDNVVLQNNSIDVDFEKEIETRELFKYSNATDVAKLIMATKHDTCVYEDKEESIIVLMDLHRLASDRDDYHKYYGQVYKEYFYKSTCDTDNDFMPKWIEGRLKFLNKFLARETILPECHSSDLITCDETLDKKARTNLAFERMHLESQSEEK